MYTSSQGYTCTCKLVYVEMYLRKVFALYEAKPLPSKQGSLDVEVCSLLFLGRLRPKSIVGVNLIELWFTNKQAFQYPCYSKILERLPK